MTAKTLTLAEFLLARIAEDEKNAQPRTDHRKRRESGGWTPSRRLAECEGKRRIIELAKGAHHERALAEDAGAPQSLLEQAWDEDALGYHMLCALALPYADHPDYRDEWRP